MFYIYGLALLIGLSGIFGGAVYGQNAQLDKDRMERDIDIMEKVLNELFKTSISGNRLRGVHLSSDRRAQGSYVPGYGVLFIAPAYSNLLSGKSSYVYSYSKGSGATAVVAGSRGANTVYVRSDEEEKTKGEKDKADKGETASAGRSRNARSTGDSLLQAHAELVTNNLRDFLANYADAIGQLSPGDRVMIIYNENARNSNHYVTISGCDDCLTRTMPRISAEVKREDLTAFRSGKMNRRELDSRIRVNQENPGKESYAEYKVFAGILESLYPVSQDVPYRVQNIGYHFLPSFGVIYLMDMSLRSRSEMHGYVSGRGGEGVSKAQADSAQVRLRNEAYEQFKKDIRETVLDYGRTLRNLSADQVILLSVALPTCGSCRVPARADVSVKKSVLEAYETSKMNRQQALEAISITER